MREYLKEKPIMFSSKHIQNELLTITSENPSSEDHFEKKTKAIFLHIIKALNNQKKN